MEPAHIALIITEDININNGITMDEGAFSKALLAGSMALGGLSGLHGQESPTEPGIAEPGIELPGKVEQGKLYLESDPNNAEVIIGGKIVGKTPLQLTTIPVGNNKIVLRLAGYESQLINIEIGKIGWTKKKIPLTPIKAMAVAEKPKIEKAIDIIYEGGWNVLVDGEIATKETTPCTIQISMGRHNISLTKENKIVNQLAEIGINTEKIEIKGIPVKIDIEKLLINNKWVYSWDSGASKKNISFGANGQILTGKNEFESFYRILDDGVEILSKNRRVSAEYKLSEGHFISSDNKMALTPIK
jgi:hypothetical protein